MLALEYVPNNHEGRFHEVETRFTTTTSVDKRGGWY